jgi:hypothetical protein
MRCGGAKVNLQGLVGLLPSYTAANAEQGLERSHGRAPAVEPEDELIKVDLHLVVGDAPRSPGWVRCWGLDASRWE